MIVSGQKTVKVVSSSQGVKPGGVSSQNVVSGGSLNSSTRRVRRTGIIAHK